jgi:hypothetical protein
MSHARNLSASPLGRAGSCAALAALGALALVGCGGAEPERRTITVIDQQHAPEPRLGFGTLALRMPLDQLRSRAAEPGWQLEGELRADGAVALIPAADDPAERYELTLEAGHVVQLAVRFRQPDEERVATRLQYPIRRVQPNGDWAMTDAHRRTLVVVSPHGARIVALHLASMRDQTGPRALLERLLGE